MNTGYEYWIWIGYEYKVRVSDLNNSFLATKMQQSAGSFEIWTLIRPRVDARSIYIASFCSGVIIKNFNKSYLYAIASISIT